MKDCSQLTLQKRNRTTLPWQQTAGHRVSLTSKWKMLRWESHEYNYTEKHMLTLPLWMCWWDKQLTSHGSLRYYCHLICYTRARSDLKFHACWVQNKNNKSIYAIKHIHRVWMCPLIVCRWCSKCYIHKFCYVIPGAHVYLTYSDTIFF